MLFYKSLQLTILKSWNDNRAPVCVTTFIKTILEPFFVSPTMLPANGHIILTSVRLYLLRLQVRYHQIVFYIFFFFDKLDTVLTTTIKWQH